MKWFSSKIHKPLSSDTSVTLTETGRERSQNFTMTGGRWEVLAELREHGTCSIEELAGSTPYSVNQVKGIIKTLIKSGYVKSLGTEE